MARQGPKRPEEVANTRSIELESNDRNSPTPLRSLLVLVVPPRPSPGTVRLPAALCVQLALSEAPSPEVHCKFVAAGGNAAAPH
jgi:hypothetical protein